MRAVVGIVAISLALVAGPGYAKKMYRFKVDGAVIIKDYVPSEYSHLGYDVLNSKGMVIDRVERAPTPEELKEKRAQEARAEARRQAMEKRKEEDRRLLRLYASPEDVERARQRRVEEVNSYIGLQRRRITELQEKLERSEGQAANIERKGREVPADLRLEIAQLQAAIRDAQNTIKDRQEEMIKITQEYASEYERIRVLQVYPPGTLDSEVDYERVDQAFSGQ
tara:strand:+ start:11706 stop:12377 length:672 start_codon:yes stop_codon:yes gene_type:complete